MPKGRPKGSKNKRTLQQERITKIVSAVFDLIDQELQKVQVDEDAIVVNAITQALKADLGVTGITTDVIATAVKAVPYVRAVEQEEEVEEEQAAAPVGANVPVEAIPALVAEKAPEPVPIRTPVQTTSTINDFIKGKKKLAQVESEINEAE